MPKVCEYLHDHGFEYPKAAILVVVCPLSSLIDSHIQELKDHGISACSLTDQDILELRRTFMTPFNDRSFAFLHLAIICAVSRIVAPRADLSITKTNRSRKNRFGKVFGFKIAWK